MCIATHLLCGLYIFYNCVMTNKNVALQLILRNIMTDDKSVLGQRQRVALPCNISCT
jgi:hypothetical protein